MQSNYEGFVHHTTYFDEQLGVCLGCHDGVADHVSTCGLYRCCNVCAKKMYDAGVIANKWKAKITLGFTVGRSVRTFVSPLELQDMEGYEALLCNVGTFDDEYDAMDTVVYGHEFTKTLDVKNPRATTDGMKQFYSRLRTRPIYD